MATPRHFKLARSLLFFAAGLTGIAFAWTRVLVARAERHFPAQGNFVEVEGRRIHFVEKGTGRPIILLHGVYGGLGDWTATVFDDVAARGRAIAIDRPGHGHSERGDEEPLTPAAQARILHAVLRELHAERPMIVGFSWSGGVALSYALQFPAETAGVMTVNGALYEWEDISKTTDAVLGLPLVGPLFAHTFAMPVGQFFVGAGVGRAFEPAPIDPRFVHSPIALEMRPACLLANAAEMRTLKSALRLQSAHYGEIAVPLVILAGLGDTITHADFHSYRLHDVVPHSQLFTVKGAGHQIPYSHSIDFLHALDTLRTDVEQREKTR